MHSWREKRPLKHWRYVGGFGPTVMFCVGDAHIGPLRQRFWALATPDGSLRERSAIVGSAGLRMNAGEIAIDGPGVRARLRVDEGEGVETLSRHGDSYIWTRKQGGVRMSGLIELDGEPLQFEARGIVDDSLGYHARHTVWKWSAGVGTSTDGRPVAWNLVDGVHDAPEASERSVWFGDDVEEVPPVEFAADLSHVGELAFQPWCTRTHDTNALLLRSHYTQPFGTFAGTLPNGLELREGYGVMESHDVWW